MALTREQLLAAKPKTELVEAPELGGQVIVAEISALERERLNKADFPVKDGKAVFQSEHHHARWAIAACRDENGKPLFTEADMAAVSALPCGLLERILRAAQRLSNPTPDSVEEEAKN